MRVPPLQAFSSYLQSQAAAREKAYQQQPSITISREAGSGAVTVIYVAILMQISTIHSCMI